MPSSNHLDDLLPAYALGALNDSDANQVRQHLEHCTVCQEELGVYQDITRLLPASLPQTNPPDELRARLLDELDHASDPVVPTWRLDGDTPRKGVGKRPETTTSLWRRIFKTSGQLKPGILFAGIGLIIILGVGNLLLQQRVNVLQTRIDQIHMIIEPLLPIESMVESTGIVVIDPHGNFGTIIVDSMPPSDRGQQYQVWLGRGDVVLSGGVFTIDKDGYGAIGIQAPDPLITYTRVWVTIEPRGGSEFPSDNIVLQFNQ
jgi:hypothetical protein